MSLSQVYETHMHTPLCGHAVGDPGEYAAVAEERGLAGIVVTCHNPMPDPGFGGPRIRMNESQLPQYLRLVDETTAQWSGRVDVRAGLECDYLPGFEDYLARQLQDLNLHHVLGSVHPQLQIWNTRYRNDDPVETQKLYFDHLAMAAESGL
ncbi:MAG: PHP domain-containing protein, partial [Phycisphaerae bacterium]|nr:PHP domain-containing protein [Phycisphaerae bacterium]